MYGAKDISRFWSRVDRRDDDECWTWKGAPNRGGYGVVHLLRKDVAKQYLVHRVSYELVKGEIPDGLQIDHLCRNRACVNPDHLEAVTLTENLRRGESLWALNSRKTHCKRGHPLSGDNLYLRETGKQRQCRECARETNRRSYARNYSKASFKARGEWPSWRKPKLEAIEDEGK